MRGECERRHDDSAEVLDEEGDLRSQSGAVARPPVWRGLTADQRLPALRSVPSSSPSATSTDPEPKREVHPIRAHADSPRVPGAQDRERERRMPRASLGDGLLASRFCSDRAHDDRYAAPQRTVKVRAANTVPARRPPGRRRIRASAANHQCPVSCLVEDGRVSGKRQIHRATAADVVRTTSL